MKSVYSEGAPKPFGPYSQGVIANGFVYTAGQVANDPSTGKLVEGGIKEQTARVLENLKAILQEAGSSLDKVVKVTVFLKDKNDFAGMNEVFAGYFQNNKPARSTIQAEMVREGWLVEIEAVAAL
jgi:2-iminobutanoate/2-iminopropanoate deaminase